MGYSTQELIDIVRESTGARSAEVSDAIVLKYINLEYPKLLNRVYFRNKNIGYNEWTTNLIAGQSKYSKLTAVQPNTVTHTPGVYGQCDITKVMVKYDTDQQYYSQAQCVNGNNFNTDLSYYRTSEPKDKPMFIDYDKYIEIFPAPLINMADGLVLTGTKLPYNLTLDTTAGCGGSTADNLLPDQYQDLLAYAVRPHIFRYRKLPNDVALALQDFQRMEMDMNWNLAFTETEPIQGVDTDYTSIS